MMKIAIAGTNGLAQFIGYYLNQYTSHTFVFITRTVNPGLRQRGWQVLVASHEDQASLVYALKGIDLVISTIAGKPQLALIDAAATARVDLFVPSAFSGPEQSQPQATGQAMWDEAIGLLEYHQITSSMRYTVFTCGIFYERFGPGGLNALQISMSNNLHGAIGDEGSFLLDMRAGKATIPLIPGKDEAAICLTSTRDVARYLVATIQAYEDLGSWPNEYKFCTEKYTMTELVSICSKVRGSPITPTFTDTAALIHNFHSAVKSKNTDRALLLTQYIAVAELHPALNFPATEINLPQDILTSVCAWGTEPAQLERFEAWLRQAWTPAATAKSVTQANVNTSDKKSVSSSRSNRGQKPNRHAAQ